MVRVAIAERKVAKIGRRFADIYVANKSFEVVVVFILNIERNLSELFQYQGFCGRDRHVLRSKNKKLNRSSFLLKRR